MGYSSSVQIDELDSKLATLRSLTLLGPGLPKQGANWGGENAMKTTWYPGNPDDATQQVIVAKELPSKWEGMWHLTMMTRLPSRFRDGTGGGAQDVTSPGLLADVLDDFRMQGRLLRVTWAVASSTPGLARTIVRLGRMVRADFKYKRAVDIDWEVEWNWKSRGGVQSRVVSTRDDNVNSAASALAAAAQASAVAVQSTIQSVNKQLRSSASLFTLAQLSVLAEAPNELVAGITQQLGKVVGQFNAVASLTYQVKGLPFSLANQAVDFARDTMDLGNQFVDDMSRSTCEQDCLSDNVADLSRSFCYFAHVEDSVQLANQRAAELQAQIRISRSGNPGGGAVSSAATGSTQVRDVIAIRRTRKGDTPVSLSMLYYGTPDRDVDIMTFNRLPLYQASFDVGTMVVIPVLTTSQGT